MKMRFLPIPLAAVVVLGGCVTVPTGPAVMVLPGSHKTLDQFYADDMACRGYANAMLGGANAGQAAANAATSNAVAGTAIGAAAGALIGAAAGDAGAGAAVGAGMGLLVGSTAGSNVAGYSYYTLQRDYDVAYMQCMYARGNQVPWHVNQRGTLPYYPPAGAPGGSYPPPNAPPPNNRGPTNPTPGSYPPPSYPPPNTPPPGG